MGALEDFINKMKKEKRYILLYNKDTIVAEQREDGLIYPIDDFVPPSLFGYPGEQHTCTFEEFEVWLKGRILPENRISLKHDLSLEGVDFYEPWLILSKTKGMKHGEDYYSFGWRIIE